MDAVAGTGIDAFIGGVEAQQIPVDRRDALLIYRLVPLTGAAATLEVETGIEIGELAGWPAVPPHWVHVPNSLQLAGGGQQPSTLDGWSRYSRPHPGRLDASAAPAREWIAHVRALLGTAT
jgi:hypothetical protein